MSLSAKEVLLSDGVHYAPAVVSVNLDGTVNGGRDGGASIARPSAITLTDVLASITPVTLAAANANRKSLVITNDSNATLYVLYGSGTPSATTYTAKLEAGGVLIETVLADGKCQWLGDIKGVWSAANGLAMVSDGV